MYGWYSLNAYNQGASEYIYINNDGQETYCTCVNNVNICPDKFNDDIVYCGEIRYFVREIKYK